MADMDLLEVNWLAALLLPQMNQRKKVICNTLADLTESASKAEALLAEADAVTQTPVASNGSFTRGRLINSPRDQSPLLNVDVLTEDAGGALDVGVARQLKPYAQAIVEKLKFAHNALISSLEGFAVAERNLKFAQSLGEMDLEEASALLQVTCSVANTSTPQFHLALLLISIGTKCCSIRRLAVSVGSQKSKQSNEPRSAKKEVDRF